MMKLTINVPYIGCHVWSEHGNPSHGPEHGPKVSIAPKSLGTIAASHSQYAAPDLLTVQWSNGATSKHYFYELDCIGPFDSPHTFRAAFRHAQNAQIWRGPRGGFRGFTAEIPFDGKFYPVHFDKNDKGRFDQIEAFLREGNIPLQIHQAPKRRPQRVI